MLDRRAPLTQLFLLFLRLGLTSFGGPIAHLGYFRNEFVERRRWLSDQAYADLVALCQFLPGPASSQVVIGIGWRWCRTDAPAAQSTLSIPVDQRTAAGMLIGFFVLLALTLLPTDRVGVHWIDLLAAMYHSGALVFGGGHVVLPLL